MLRVATADVRVGTYGLQDIFNRKEKVGLISATSTINYSIRRLELACFKCVFDMIISIDVYLRVN